MARSDLYVVFGGGEGHGVDAFFRAQAFSNRCRRRLESLEAPGGPNPTAGDDVLVG